MRNLKNSNAFQVHIISIEEGIFRYNRCILRLHTNFIPQAFIKARRHIFFGKKKKKSRQIDRYNDHLRTYEVHIHTPGYRTM